MYIFKKIYVAKNYFFVYYANTRKKARWQSGYAEDCKSLDAGSIPTLASKFSKMITKLILTNFRNHKTSRVDVMGAKNIVIVGENGAGKTAVLEAISMLSGDKGMRGADMSDIACFNGDGGFSVFGEIATGDLISVYFNHGDNNRHAKINNENASLGDLGKLLRIVWISPKEDRLFVDAIADRRTFFDRLASNFDSSHIGRSAKFTKLLSERAFALKSGADTHWLDALDDQLAGVAVAVAAARVQYAGQINFFLESFSVSVDGFIEKMIIDGIPAAQVEREYRNYLAQNRELVSDKMILDGPHKSDFGMFNNKLQLPVKLTSTGQQKNALFDLILAHTDLLHTKTKQDCIVLLDEAAAHLDAGARAKIFNKLNETHTQVWATGLDANSFIDVPEPLIVTCMDGEISSIIHQKQEI